MAEQAVADLEQLKRLVQERRPEGGQEKNIRKRKRHAKEKRPAWLVVAGSVELVAALDDLSALEGAAWGALDGTNNASERAIGWWVKERYRSMRGYKRVESAVNGSRLLAWYRGGVNLVRVLS